VLVPQKVTKEDDTQPSRPYGSLVLLSLGLSSDALLDLGISRSRNSPWQATHFVACCGAQTVAPSTLILSPLLSVMNGIILT